MNTQPRRKGNGLDPDQAKLEAYRAQLVAEGHEGSELLMLVNARQRELGIPEVPLSTIFKQPKPVQKTNPQQQPGVMKPKSGSGVQPGDLSHWRSEWRAAERDGDVRRASDCQRHVEQLERREQRERATAPDPQPWTWQPFSDIKAEPVEWLWHHFIPRGMLTLLIGDPKLGKSRLLLDLAARISRGDTMPDGSPGVLGKVVYISGEDDAKRVLKPALIAVRAGMNRVICMQGRSLTDTSGLRQSLTQIGDVALLVIDALNDFVGGTDMYKDVAVRQLLTPVMELAEELQVTVVLVVHLTKNTSTAAIYRALGGIGLTAKSRSTLAVGQDSTDPDRRLFGVVGTNLGPSNPGSLAYKIVGARVREIGGAEVGRVIWESGRSDVTAAQFLAPAPERNTKLDAATEWLQELLAHHPVPAHQALEEGKALGFSADILFLARKALGIESKNEGRRGSTWLPLSLQDTHTETMDERTTEQPQPLVRSFVRSIELKNQRQLTNERIKTSVQTQRTNERTNELNTEQPQQRPLIRNPRPRIRQREQTRE